jgi:sporulation protein YlmC with PRC-barrel domain
MRLSDLLERTVIDDRGRNWGPVHDVHLVQDGPLLPSGNAAFRLHGLVAGRGGFGTRLGYSGRRGYDTDQHTRGPLPIKLLVRWLNRHAVYIPWEAVLRVDDDQLLVHSDGGGFGPAG